MNDRPWWHLMWCYFAHRRWHVWLLNSGEFPWPFSFMNNELSWYCKECDGPPRNPDHLFVYMRQGLVGAR